ncbi:DMT family transporter [Chachezhania antarctica]|uniref:DMT family transporter n=1 Tax=Chachezhania antarctica TaxID=2340860 RepID=UPI000EAE5857|nr:DMT family transporter [Chachezhania antarctica]|tara:strand:+ start:5177 stop:6115 length:939 start_codon:yes stop_codon:yes gene_type:complete
MTQQKSLSPRDWGLMFLLALIWGGTFPSVRVALFELTPLTAVLHRTFWAALALWVLALVTRQKLPRNPGTWAAFLVMGLINNAIPFSLQAWGQLHIESGLAAILNASTAIFGVLVAALVFADERLTTRKLAGVVLGFLGVATTVGLSNLMALDLHSLAQLAVIAGTVSYAFAGAFARTYLGGLSPIVAAAGMLTGATIWMLPIAITADGLPSFDLQPQTWAAVSYYALIATAGAFLLYYRILSSAGSGNLLIVTLLVAPVSIVIGAVGLDEELAPRAFAGFAILAVGLLTLNGTLFRGALLRRLRHPAIDPR